MTNANESLRQSTGSERYFKDLLTGCKYTDGVKALADTCQAYWLLDVIFSYQNYKNFIHEEFQVWELKRVAGIAFMVTATDGNKRKLGCQEIPFSDFEFDSATIWIEHGVALLPS
eukprot:gene55460-75990_t